MIKYTQLFSILFTISILSACESSDTAEAEKTSIEGQWISECLSSPVFSGLSPSSPVYFNQRHTYNSYSVNTITNVYDDSDCLIINNTNIDGLYSSSTEVASYVSGDSIITSDGTDANIVYLTIRNGNIIEDIYAIINNGNTLVFGKRTAEEYFACYNVANPLLPGSSLGGSSTSCNRPQELDYEKPLSRVVE